MNARFALVREPIDVEAVRQAVVRPEAGAVAMFIGSVRSNSRGRAISHIEYEAYDPMVLRQLEGIGQEIEQRWPEARAAIVHRVGQLAVGEISIAIAISSPHRQAAFEGCRLAIEGVKTRLPLWKKEFWETSAVAEAGSAWVEGEPAFPLKGL